MTEAETLTAPITDWATFCAANAFDDFARVVDPTVYAALPDEWTLAITDVVGSTRAIAAGRYKAVNMAGAAAITAVLNAADKTMLPFVFGGDGAAIAVPPAHTDAANRALAKTVLWVRDELDLALRAAMVPVSAVRAAGHDVRVAAFRASDAVNYAMFTGGGLAFAEAAMKAGSFTIAAQDDARPDLEGLSCRWTPIEGGDGVILSVIVRPATGVDEAAFADVIGALLALLVREAPDHPVPARGPGFTWPPEGLDLEARAARGTKPLAKARRELRLITLIAWLLDKTGIKVAGFDPKAYRRYTALNTDFRKFDDGLKMTLKTSQAVADRIEALCAAAEAEGTVRAGVHRQASAVMTCIVPSIVSNTHFHFLDGAGGGYAAAAERIKDRPAG